MLRKNLQRRFKNSSLNQHGFTLHFVLPLIVIVCVGAIGAYLVSHGHAATLTTYDTIVVKSSQNQCVDNKYSKKAAYNEVQIYKCNGTGAQGWVVNATAAKAGEIINSNGYCLNVYNAGKTVGTPVDIYPCKNSAAQQWIANNTTGAITNPNSKLCLSYSTPLITTGTPLKLATCSTTAATDQWKVIMPTVTSTGGGSSGGSGSGGIITAGNSKAKCLALPGATQGEVSLASLNSAESTTGLTYNCLETFANPVDNWTDWESPWQFSNDPSTTDTTSTYQTWAAWLKMGHQMILGVDLVPQNAPGVDTSNSNQGNPLQWEQACAAGSYNSYATQLANNLKGWGAGSIVIRLGIEANGGWEADYVGSTSAEGSAWAKCYSNEVSAMKAVDPGLLFVWNPNACQTDPQTASGKSPMLTSLSEWYPGNSAVDIVAADDYDTDCTNSKLVSQEGWSAYASAQNGGGTSLSQIAAFAASNNKPFALPEWGLNNTGDDDPAYVQGVASLISSSSNFSFNSYFDTNDDGIAPLGSTIPNATAAYKQAIK